MMCSAFLIPQELGKNWRKASKEEGWQDLFSFFNLNGLVDNYRAPAGEKGGSKAGKAGEPKPSKAQTETAVTKPSKKAQKAAAGADKAAELTQTPKKAQGKKKASPKMTPEGKVVQRRCRPGDFGQPDAKSKGPVLMARAHRPVDFGDEEAIIPVKPPRKSMEEADRNCEIDSEKGGSGDEIHRIRRKSHKRACRKKVLCDRELQEKATKSYLGSIGVTWPVFQSFYARLGGAPFQSCLSFQVVL